ncbi:MAG: hypothetical protein KDA24_18060 [Deltaproteobacteria bacterium]|nr:hypothetical protein [Deltaproteobacteria bacterium]
MLGKDPFRIVFGSGVVRFDAHDNLFVNLAHTDESPQQVRIGSESGTAVSAPERRARVHGTTEGGQVSGAFPASADLPRGLTVEVKGFESATLADGKLVVTLAAGATIPDWWESGQDHHFAAADTALRLWVKSSMPAGVTLEGEVAAGGPPTQPKPAARAQFQPVSETAKAKPEPDAPPKAKVKTDEPAAADGQPYRPGRLPAGHYKTAEKKSGLGCSTLIVLVALTAGAVLALL